MSNPISENRERHEREIARIRANPDLSAGAKNRKIADVHERASAEHRRLVAEARRESEAAVRAAERRVLGIPYPENARPHERAIIAMCYRDAADAYLGERPAARAHWEGYVEARNGAAASAPVGSLFDKAAAEIAPPAPAELPPGRAAS